jgi:hypothetical protein
MLVIVLCSVFVSAFLAENEERIDNELSLIGAQKLLSSASFNDLPATMGFVNLQFDSEIFVSEDIFCSSRNFEKRTPSCIPCNYTGPSMGEKMNSSLFFFQFIPLSDGNCVNQDLNVPNLSSIEGLGLPNCPCNPKYCEGVVLQQGIFYILISFTSPHFR